ncbi:hypothetical protein ACFL21_01675 [Patescibacteria group bacterium]
METSIFLAKLLAVFYLVIGVGLFINAKYFRKAWEEIYKSPALIVYGAIMALIFGLFFISVHNVWEKEWFVLITLLGWAGLLKGTLLFVAPKFLLNLTRPFLKMLRVCGLFAIFVGVIFAYFGFVA